MPAGPELGSTLSLSYFNASIPKNLDGDVRLNVARVARSTVEYLIYAHRPDRAFNLECVFVATNKIDSSLNPIVRQVLVDLDVILHNPEIEVLDTLLKGSLSGN